MDYCPGPIDTTQLTLPDDLLVLTEKLAENVHELWAQKRLAEGWRYGTQRNDLKKLHPCLVPYNELPESEKAYDQETAIQTLKVVLALGYQIQKSRTGELIP